MLEQATGFREKIDGIRGGSADAAWQLIEEYGPHIQRVVRRHLNRRMRSKFDSLDFVQMVWASFFRDPRQMLSFEDPDQLIGYLAVLTRNKVIEEFRRRFQTHKYNVGRERSLDDSDVDPNHPSDHHTPSQIAMARERWTQLMRDQPERNRMVLRLRMQGATFSEISRELGIHEKTARKVIEQLVGVT